MDDTSFHLGDYFKPKSLTWWAGCLSLVVGGAQAFGVQHAGVGVVSEVLAGLTGAVDAPAQLILGGLGLVGIRAKLGRK